MSVEFRREMIEGFLEIHGIEEIGSGCDALTRNVQLEFADDLADTAAFVRLATDEYAWVVKVLADRLGSDVVSVSNQIVHWVAAADAARRRVAWLETKKGVE